MRAFYTDLDNIKTVHPLVVSVRRTARIETTDGYQQTYRVTDRIPLGPFTLRTRYVAILTVPTVGEVTAEARQFPWVHLFTRLAFESIDTGTRITERVTIDAPRPLASITAREAVKAHIDVLAGIRHHFGG
ncbi:MAG TPA: SRPBCC family protein [Mycobacterium sp.]|nr:SRPBCC family protein [Mycobacterium sp.]